MRCSVRQRCISYYSYIKPQHLQDSISHQRVVYRTIPTSNHNPLYAASVRSWLYIVLFLHQTTTGELYSKVSIRCISYYSYIKPQPSPGFSPRALVVYRTIPTSNHNLLHVLDEYLEVVYRTIPTSNHNL